MLCTAAAAAAVEAVLVQNDVHRFARSHVDQHESVIKAATTEKGPAECGFGNDTLYHPTHYSACLLALALVALNHS